MTLPDNSISQGQPPEQQKQPQQIVEQGSSEISENATRSSGPQPIANPAKDDAAAQSIANNLKNGLGQTPVSGSANPSPQPAPKKPSSEPYIKAAEKVIQEDKGNPYKEEEDHEAVQVQYLKDRFGKIIERE